MVDIQFVRENPELVKQKSAEKGYAVDIDALLVLDDERKVLLGQVESLRQRRNEIAASMKGGKPEQALIDEGKQVKVELAEREALLTETEANWLSLLKKVPNMPLEDVPVGPSEDENVVAKEWGDKFVFEFEIQNHW